MNAKRLNLPGKVTFSGGSVTALEIDYQYNSIGQVTQTAEKQNGAVVATITNAYDGDGNLRDISALDPAQTLLDSFSYVFDGESQVTSINGGIDGYTSYAYDHAGQLTNASYIATPSANGEIKRDRSN